MISLASQGHDVQRQREGDRHKTLHSERVRHSKAPKLIIHGTGVDDSADYNVREHEEGAVRHQSLGDVGKVKDVCPEDGVHEESCFWLDGGIERSQSHATEHNQCEHAIVNVDRVDGN
jgi:hypothetical protein